MLNSLVKKNVYLERQLINLPEFFNESQNIANKMYLNKKITIINAKKLKKQFRWRTFEYFEIV